MTERALCARGEEVMARLRADRDETWRCMARQLLPVLNRNMAAVCVDGIHVVGRAVVEEVGSTARGVDVGLADLDKFLVVPLDAPLKVALDSVSNRVVKASVNGTSVTATLLATLSLVFLRSVKEFLK